MPEASAEQALGLGSRLERCTCDEVNARGIGGVVEVDAVGEVV